MKSNQQVRHPQRVRNVAAFVKSLLSRRSDYAISTNQMRSAFQRASGAVA